MSRHFTLAIIATILVGCGSVRIRSSESKNLVSDIIFLRNQAICLDTTSLPLPAEENTKEFVRLVAIEIERRDFQTVFISSKQSAVQACTQSIKFKKLNITYYHPISVHSASLISILTLFIVPSWQNYDVAQVTLEKQSMQALSTGEFKSKTLTIDWLLFFPVQLFQAAVGSFKPVADNPYLARKFTNSILGDP